MLATGVGLQGAVRSAAAAAPVWPRAAFVAEIEAHVITALFGGALPRASPAVKLTAPFQSDGETVPVTVTADLEGIRAIAVVARNNPNPLCSVLSPFRGAVGFYSTRIRLHGTSPVTAYVQAQDGVYMASAMVKVTAGGYGVGG